MGTKALVMLSRTEWRSLIEVSDQISIAGKGLILEPLGGSRRRIELVVDHLGQALARLIGLALACPEACVNAATGEKLLVRAPLDTLTMVEHDAVVGVDHGGETMGDDERRALARDPLQRVLDLLLSVAVERRGRLVEHEDGRRFEDGAGDGHALLLAARELQSPLAHERVVALRQRYDKVVDLGKFRRLAHLAVAGLWAPIADVVENGVVEQHGVLGDHADGGAERALRNVADILPVN